MSTAGALAVVVAHAGHWIVDLLYVLPVIAIAAVGVWVWWRERREGDEPPDDR